MENEERTELSIASDAQSAERNASRFMQQFGAGQNGFQQLSPMPDGTPQEKAQLWRLSQSEGELLGNVVNVPIDVVNWLIQPATVEREQTGEIVTFPLLKLLCADGRIFRTTGVKVIKSVLGYNYSVRSAPWIPPIRFKVVRKPGRGTNSFYDLEAFQDTATGIGDDSPGLNPPAKRSRNQ